MFGADASFAIDDEGNRQAQNSAVKIASLGTAQGHRIVHLELVVKIADRLRAIVHRNAYDLQASFTVFVLQFYEARNFFTAGIAPGGPKVQQNYLAAIDGKAQRVPAYIRKGKVRR